MGAARGNPDLRRRRRLHRLMAVNAHCIKKVRQTSIFLFSFTAAAAFDPNTYET